MTREEIGSEINYQRVEQDTIGTQVVFHHVYNSWYKHANNKDFEMKINCISAIVGPINSNI